MVVDSSMNVRACFLEELALFAFAIRIVILLISMPASISSVREAQVLRCGHAMHRDCLESYLQHGK